MNSSTAVTPIVAQWSGATSERARAGRVVSTSGSQIVILLDSNVSAADSLQMGSLVCARSPHALVFGLVEALSTPMPMQPPGETAELKIAEIGLLGEVPDAMPGATNFRRGISKLPSLDATVFLANHEDTATIFALPNRQSICIGNVHQDPRVPAQVSVNDMLCKHFAMLGTTGTGKSCALTLMLKRILEQSPNGHVLLLDPHGEYELAFGDLAEHLSARNFRLPYWLFTFEELTEVVFGQEKHDMAVEIMHLRELVLAAKLAMARGAERQWITVDSPVPYLMSALNRLLDTAIGSLDNRGSLPAYLRIKSRLALLQTDRRFALMFDTGLVLRDNFSSLLGRIFRVPANGRPLAILDRATERRGRRDLPSRLRPRDLDRPAPAAASGLRRSPSLRPAGRRLRVPAGQAGAVAHRQGGPQIRHQPGRRQSAPVRAGRHHPVAVQHRVRVPHEQRT